MSNERRMKSWSVYTNDATTRIVILDEHGEGTAWQVPSSEFGAMVSRYFRQLPLNVRLRAAWAIVTEGGRQ